MGKQILVLMPEGKPGEPDWDTYGLTLGPVPEGTHELDVEAHWHIDSPDGTFRGGAQRMKFLVVER